MTLPAAVILTMMLSVGCSQVAAPPGSASSTPPPSEAPQPLFLPFPPGIVIEPGPDSPSATLTATSTAGAEIGVVYAFELGHCGLGSPFDFDGSLWDPTGALDRLGGPVDAEQEVGELINAVRGELVLVGRDRAQFLTPRQTVVALTRHAGAKEYSLCD